MNKDLLDKGVDLAKHVTSRPITTALTIIFMMSCILSIVIYQDRHALFNWYAAQQQKEAFVAKLDDSMFASQMAKLMQNAKAISATVWSVDLAQNKKEVLYSINAATDTRQRVQYFNTSMPFFNSNDKTNDAMVELQKYANQTICYELNVETEFDEHIKNEGVNWVCAISVPPETGQFIGMITIGFIKKPDATEGVFNRRMVNAANNIIRFKDKKKPMIGTDE